jgi:hypothetical protein
MRSIRTLVVLFLCVVAPAAFGQVEEVVVTGARISGDDYSQIPAIVLHRRADFLVQRVRLTNDTRAESGRVSELQQTIRDMYREASRRQGIALSYGDDFLIPVTATANELTFGPGGKRPDTSSTSIYVKMALKPNEDVPAAIASLRDFIKKARPTGRTEIEAEGDVGLSLVEPEKYRYEIIARIAEDARKLRASVGPACRVQISGLASRVAWQRSDISELTLYVPYEVDLSECQ